MENRCSLDFSTERDDYMCETELCSGELSPGEFDFMGRIPVPLKYTFKDGLEAVLKKHRIEKRIRLNCYFPMGGGSGYFPFENIHNVDSIDDFPNMVLSPSFDNLFEKHFFEKFIDKGYFQACQPKPLHQIYADCGIEDPEKQFTIFAIVPFVFLVDHRKLDGLPVPRRWIDILDPIYHNKIIIGGWRKDENSPYSEFNSFLFLDLYKEHGIQSLKYLAYNTKNMLHYVHMSRIAGSNSELGAAIYIIPWFLADICPRRENTSIIWPEDGALAFPIYFLAKKSKLDKLNVLIKYATGKGLGQCLVDNCYPSLSPEVNYRYPTNAKLKWLGWDYVRSNDTMELIRLTSKVFFEVWQSTPFTKT